MKRSVRDQNALDRCSKSVVHSELSVPAKEEAWFQCGVGRSRLGLISPRLPGSIQGSATRYPDRSHTEANTKDPAAPPLIWGASRVLLSHKQMRYRAALIAGDPGTFGGALKNNTDDPDDRALSIVPHFGLLPPPHPKSHRCTVGSTPLSPHR